MASSWGFKLISTLLICLCVSAGMANKLRRNPVDSTSLTDLYDSTNTHSTDATDSTDTTAQTSPTDSTDTTAHTSPTDSTDTTAQTSPTDSTDTTAQTSPTDSTVPTTQTSPTDSTDTTAQTSPTVPTTQTSPTDSTDTTDSTVPTTQTSPTDSTDTTDSTVPTTQTSPTDTTTQTSPTDSTDTTDSTVPTTQTSPTDSTDTTDSTVPTTQTSPTDTTTQTSPTDSTDTTDSTVPTTQTSPTDSTDTTDSTVPTTQTSPTDSTDTTDSTVPTTQTSPTDTTTQTSPTDTTTQTSPTDPTTQISPTGSTDQTATQPPSKPPTQPPTKTPVECLNGGTLNSDGESCSCPIGFEGNVCERVKISLQPATIDRTAVGNMELKEEYKPEYGNLSSPQYKQFVTKFTNEMVEYYRGKNITYFKRVLVTSVRPGAPFSRNSNNSMDEVRSLGRDVSVYSIRPKSVHVSHDVVLEVPNTDSSEEQYDASFEDVDDALRGLSSCTTDCPDFEVTDAELQKMEVDLNAVCEDFIRNPELAPYYEAHSTGGVITCVTPCDSRHSWPRKCHNKGTCSVYKDAGVLCTCRNVNSTWYLGDDCAYAIQKNAFYAGLSATLAALLVIVGALAAYTAVNKERHSRQKDMKKKLVDQWLDDDYEWSKSNSKNITSYTGTTYNNPSYRDGDSGIHKQTSSSSRQV